MSSGNIHGKTITVYQTINVNKEDNIKYITHGKASLLDKLLEELIALTSIIEENNIENERKKWRYKLKVNFSNGEHYLKIPESSYEAVKRYILSEIEIAQNNLREKIFNDLKSLPSEELIEVYKVIEKIKNRYF